MKKVLILTKTDWSEPPRIRHQITRLLKEQGYKITFVERNKYKSAFIKFRTEEDIDFYSHAQLIHHQLRYFTIIQKLNNSLVKFYLKKIIKKVEFDFIMFDKLSSYKDNVTLFFPWSQREYLKPKENSERNTVLYFGFVGRLNWNLTEEVIKNSNYHFRFVGPTIRNSDQKMVSHLKTSYSNFSYIPYSKIEELKVDDAFCSILPYDPTLGNVQATTVSNRAFNLLSLGLPLAYADLRNIIKSSDRIIRTNKTIEEYLDTLDFFHKNFNEVQQDIELFLEDHYKSIRWKVLEDLIENK